MSGYFNPRVLFAALFIVISVYLSRAYAQPPALPQPQKALSRIAFGSCLNQEAPQPIWNAVSKLKPEIFFLLGDNVYAKSDNIEKIAAAYATQRTHPDYAAFARHTPIHAVWDDNDYGPPDSGAEFPYKGESKKLFLDFFNAAENDPRRSREGIYDSWTFGTAGRRVQIIALDTRTFRGPLAKRLPLALPGVGGPYTPHHEDAVDSMLGSEQWRWLTDQLSAVTELRIVLSSIQLLSDQHGFETWGNFQNEQRRLISLLTLSRIPTIVLSGDRHQGELSAQHTASGLPVIDFTSSALNVPRPPVKEPNPYRVKGPYFAENFGVIDFEWRVSPRVSLSLHNTRGETIFSETFGF